MARIKARYSLSLIALFFLGTYAQGFAADPKIKAGRVALTLPGPAGDFTEAGDRLKTTFFELLVPSNNRLLTAYAPERPLAEMNKGNSTNSLNTWAMLEVSRRAEYTDLTPQAFTQILKSLEPTMGKFETEKMGQLEQEMNIRLQTLSTKPIEIGHPEMLGPIFQKTDAAGYAMLMSIEQGERTDKVAAGMAVLRVKQRLVFAYLYRIYESPSTIPWIRKNLEAWSNTIFTKNQ